MRGKGVFLCIHFILLRNSLPKYSVNMFTVRPSVHGKLTSYIVRKVRTRLDVYDFLRYLVWFTLTLRASFIGTIFTKNTAPVIAVDVKYVITACASRKFVVSIYIKLAILLSFSLQDTKSGEPVYFSLCHTWRIMSHS